MLDNRDRHKGRGGCTDAWPRLAAVRKRTKRQGRGGRERRGNVPATGREMAALKRRSGRIDPSNPCGMQGAWIHHRDEGSRLAGTSIPPRLTAAGKERTPRRPKSKRPRAARLRPSGSDKTGKWMQVRRVFPANQSRKLHFISLPRTGHLWGALTGPVF